MEVTVYTCSVFVSYFDVALTVTISTRNVSLFYTFFIHVHDTMQIVFVTSINKFYCVRTALILYTYCMFMNAGLLCDLLWSDPDKEVTTGWGENDRGVSFTFGIEIVNKFLTKHDMDLICRAHQVVEDGYEFFAKRQLVTLFSAPNYCGEFDNAGAMMSVDETLMCSFQVSDYNTMHTHNSFLLPKKIAIFCWFELISIFLYVQNRQLRFG